jgi:hypothetical protein
MEYELHWLMTSAIIEVGLGKYSDYSIQVFVSTYKDLLVMK